MTVSFTVKRVFKNYFRRHSSIENERVFLRPYTPSEDTIYPNFSNQDWNMIFTDVDEATFNQMAQHYIDRVILVGCDKLDSKPFGFICIQESHDTPKEVFFHGGTWEHDTKHILLEYSATDLILQFLIDKGFSIKVTCFLDNKKADKFQKSLGFAEYKRDELLSYKQLHLSSFRNNIVKKMGKRHIDSSTVDNPWTNINWENTVAERDKAQLSPAYCAEHGIDIGERLKKHKKRER